MINRSIGYGQLLHPQSLHSICSSGLLCGSQLAFADSNSFPASLGQRALCAGCCCVLPALISFPLHLPLPGGRAGTSSQALPLSPASLRLMGMNPRASVREAPRFQLGQRENLKEEQEVKPKSSSFFLREKQQGWSYHWRTMCILQCSFSLLWSNVPMLPSHLAPNPFNSMILIYSLLEYINDYQL